MAIGVHVACDPSADFSLPQSHVQHEKDANRGRIASLRSRDGYVTETLRFISSELHLPSIAFPNRFNRCERIERRSPRLHQPASPALPDEQDPMMGRYGNRLAGVVVAAFRILQVKAIGFFSSQRRDWPVRRQKRSQMMAVIVGCFGQDSANLDPVVAVVVERFANRSNSNPLRATGSRLDLSSAISAADVWGVPSQSMLKMAVTHEMLDNRINSQNQPRRSRKISAMNGPVIYPPLITAV